MKYIRKYNESESAYGAKEKIEKWRNDIIKKLVYYHNNFSDNLSKEIEQFIWEYEDTNTYTEVDGVIDEECVSMLIDNVLQDWVRNQDKFLELYYDIHQTLKNRGEDLTEQLKEIFADYSDDDSLRVRIYRTADSSDDRYEISISGEDNMFNKISFNEIINRTKDIGLSKFKYSGDDSSISFSFWKEVDDNYDDVEIDD